MFCKRQKLKDQSRQEAAEDFLYSHSRNATASRSKKGPMQRVTQTAQTRAYPGTYSQTINFIHLLHPLLPLLEFSHLHVVPKMCPSWVWVAVWPVCMLSQLMMSALMKISTVSSSDSSSAPMNGKTHREVHCVRIMLSLAPAPTLMLTLSI